MLAWLLSLAIAVPVPAQDCTSRGFKSVSITVGQWRRQFWWRAPVGDWNGAVLLLHGDGGSSADYCAAAAGPVTRPQVEFASLALARGLAVFSIDSTRSVADRAGRGCGKVWDDAGRPERSADLQFIARLIESEIPQRRPEGSSRDVFIAGLSSGGSMGLRAATYFDGAITAAALVAAVDPHGSYRVCGGGTGRLHDLETNLDLGRINACMTPSGRYPGERRWDAAGTAAPPSFAVFHAEDDAIQDFSCHHKLVEQLTARGYPTTVHVLQGKGTRSADQHGWQRNFSGSMVEFFLGFSTGAPPRRD